MIRIFALVCALIWLSTTASAQTLVGDRVRLNTGPCVLMSGNGTPEGTRIGSVCDMYVNTTNGTWWTKWTGTATNTGWGVGHNANARVNGTLTLTDYATSPAYTSQTSGWRIDNLGAADFRYIFADEMHVKSFIADLEQALAGGQIISKSVAPLAADFTCPTTGGSAPMVVESFPGFPDVQVFQIGDWVSVRQFDRTLGALNIADCVGQVVSPVVTGMTQTWTFFRSTGSSAGAATAGAVVGAKALVLDYGVSGNGYYEVNSIDGIFSQNSPYAQTVTWAGAPTAANRTVRTRTGNLRGITGFPGEFGFYAAGPDVGSALIASSRVLSAVNMDLQLFSGATEVIRLNHLVPSLAIGSAIPTGYAAGTGIWMGRDADGLYKFRVGVPGGERVQWTGTSLQIFGQGGGITDINGANIRTGSISADKATFGAGLNQIQNSDCAASTVDWSVFGSSGQVPIQATAFPGYNLNNQNATCYVTFTGAPGVGTATGLFTVPTYPVVAGNRYESSAYLGVVRSGLTTLSVQWFNISGAILGQSNGTNCTASFPGGQALGSYCRSAFIGNAPVSATSARVVVQTTHTGEAQPFLFLVHASFGGATNNQAEVSPWGPAGLTEIIGGMIRTRTIQADKIVAGSITGNEISGNTITGGHIQGNTITAGHIQAGAIDATKIVAGSITGDRVQAGAITADKISVGSLAAISANLGAVTAGSINISGGGGLFSLAPNGDTVVNTLFVNNGLNVTGTMNMGGTMNVPGGIHIPGVSTQSYVCIDGGGNFFYRNFACVP